MIHWYEGNVFSKLHLFIILYFLFLAYDFYNFETQITVIPIAVLAVVLCLLSSNQLLVQIYIGLETLYLLFACATENVILVLGLTNVSFASLTNKTIKIFHFVFVVNLLFPSYVIDITDLRLKWDKNWIDHGVFIS